MSWPFQPLPAAGQQDAAAAFLSCWALGSNNLLGAGAHTMRKNVASQVIGAQLVSATDGSAFTGAVTVAVTGDGGTQATGSVGSGACTHEGNGFHTYAPAQAETNYDHIGFTFTGTGAVPATVQVYPTFPQTGDNFARIGAPVGASISADVAAVKTQTAAIETDTQDLQTRVPVALVSGRIDASVGAMAANTLTASAIAADAITAAKVADGAIDAATFAAGAINAAAIASDAITAAKIADGAIDAATFATGAITAAAIAADAIGASELAADAVAEIQSGLATAAAVATIDDFLDTEIAAIITTLGTPAGASISADIAAIEAQTDDIGVAGAGLTAIPWNAAWDAEVQSEATDALNAYDPPTNAEMVERTLAAADYATAAALDAVDNFVDTEVAAIKTVADAIQAKTDNLPSDPADHSVVIAATDAILTAVGTVDTVVDAIKVTTDKLDDTLEDDGGTYRFTANALEEAPSGGSAPTAAEIAYAVWDEDATGHQTQGSFGQAVGDPGADTDTIWGLVNTNLNATVGSRASQASVDTIDDLVDTEVAAIKTVVDAVKVVTDALPDAGALTSLATQASVNIIDDFLDTEVAAIKAKTDNLPSDPADASDIATATTAIAGYIDTEVAAILAAVDTEVAAIKGKTDQLTFTVANKIDANATHLSGSSTAADNLEAGATGLIPGTCAAGSTTTIVVTNLTEETDDHYNGAALIFTSGALAGQRTSISDYNGTTKALTVVALTEAPADTDAFVIS
jgi:hypothetical protein